MKQTRFRPPIVKLPHGVELTLLLIREELKSRKLFHILQEAGFADSSYQPHLDDLILLSLGFNDVSDERFKRYCAIMDKRSKKIKEDHDIITKQALKVYYELILEKGKY